MNIKKHTVVSLHYKLQKDNAEGELIEETFGSDPLTFLYGAGNMIPAFEENLSGKAPGDDFSFGIQSAEAYGDFNEEAVVAVPLDIFVVDGQLQEEYLQVGKPVPLRSQDGQQMVGTVVEVQREQGQVILDFNHPMAGVDLFFTGTIESVRDATEDEVAHGHVHGPGGHHH